MKSQKLFMHAALLAVSGVDQAKTDRDPDSRIKVPKGSCEKITGGKVVG